MRHRQVVCNHFIGFYIKNYPGSGNILPPTLETIALVKSSSIFGDSVLQGHSVEMTSVFRHHLINKWRSPVGRKIIVIIDLNDAREQGIHSIKTAISTKT